MKLMIREGFIDIHNDIDAVNDFVDKNIKELQRAIRSSGYDLDLESRRHDYSLNPNIKKNCCF